MKQTGRTGDPAPFLLVLQPMRQIRQRPGKTVCLILVGKQWVIGENSTKTSPKLARTYRDGKRTYSTHAEDHALQLAARNGGKIRKIVVVRWTKSGKRSMARPCPYCEERILAAGVRWRDVYWSDWTGEIVSEQ